MGLLLKLNEEDTKIKKFEEEYDIDSYYKKMEEEKKEKNSKDDKK